MKLIKQNEKALMYQIPSGEFEVWIRLEHVRTKETLTPSDEDFGVWAWSCYTLKRANEIFDEITSGRRGVTPMVELF